MGPSGPSIGATTTPTQETPAEEPPVEEAPVAGPFRSDTPAPMETGGAGDGQSWAEWVETSLEAEFRWARPLKHPRSQSRRRGQHFPFPSKMRRGGLPPLRGFMSMWGSSSRLGMMWLAKP